MRKFRAVGSFADTFPEKTPFFFQSLNLLIFSWLTQLSSLILHPSSLRHICFGVRKLNFHLPKDRVLHAKTLCFATRNIYVWEKMRDERRGKRE